MTNKEGAIVIEKKILILGALQHSSQHGYQLAQLLDMGPFSAVRVSKANAYKLLADMEKDNWLSVTREQDGSRPPKQTYQITELGKQNFIELINQSLAQQAPSMHSWLVAFDFLDALEAEHVKSLLKVKQQIAEQKLAAFNVLTDEQLAMHPSVDFLHQSAELEYRWIKQLIHTRFPNEGK
ncbi:PadR family transcriptional regulator [Salinibius halmophilus]|uniref:PadR family transcriptional regulator n=1 Tax=Salinibius halmophilus TaxID=1853216 RepID=UPI000E65FAC8|nr:PadR family transcriptional regulator [Salinibius halmophilus]